MAAAIGQSVVETFTYGSPRTTTVTINTAATGSSFLVAFFTANGDTVNAVSDNKGNTYSSVTSVVDSTNGNKMWLYQTTNGAGGSGHTFTVTMSSGGVVLISGIEVTGAVTASLIDQTNTAFDSSTPFGCAVTTTVADSLVIGLASVIDGAGTTTFTANGSFTKFREQLATWHFAAASLAVAATGTYDPAWTQTTYGYAALITINVKSATASGYTIVAAQGSYALSGQPVTLNVGRKLSAEFGTYSLAGQDALVDVAISANQGSYGLTGQDVTLIYSGAPTPPVTPTTAVVPGSGAGFSYIRHKRPDRREKEEIRQKLEVAINGLQAEPETAPEVAEIKREHQVPRPKAAKKKAPQINWRSLQNDARAVEYLLREYERLLIRRKRQEDDDDDEERLMAILH